MQHKQNTAKLEAGEVANGIQDVDEGDRIGTDSEDESLPKCSMYPTRPYTIIIQYLINSIVDSARECCIALQVPFEVSKRVTKH